MAAGSTVSVILMPDHFRQRESRRAVRVKCAGAGQLGSALLGDVISVIIPRNRVPELIALSARVGKRTEEAPTVRVAAAGTRSQFPAQDPVGSARRGTILHAGAAVTSSTLQPTPAAVRPSRTNAAERRSPGRAYHRSCQRLCASPEGCGRRAVPAARTCAAAAAPGVGPCSSPSSSSCWAYRRRWWVARAAHAGAR